MGDGDALRSARSATVESDAPLQPARTVALDPERLRSALGALGGTPYRLADLDDRLEGSVFLPVAALKDVRRRAVAELDRQRLAVHRRAAPLAVTGAPGVPRFHAAGGDARAVGEVGEPAETGAAGGSLGGERTRGTAAARGAAGGGAPSEPLRLVLRLRPGETPVLSTGAAAVCLDLRGGDVLEDVAAAQASLAASGLEVRCRPPEILFDGDRDWWSRVAGLPWAAVYARHAAHLVSGMPLILEYPLQGLNHLTVPQMPAAGLVAGPEMSLDEIEALVAASRLPVEVFGFGRQQLLVSRDELGRQEGLVPGGAAPVAARSPTTAKGPTTATGQTVLRELSLVDGKGFVFPATVGRGETRLYNARLTNLAPAAGELIAAGVHGFIVEQGALDAHEREALRARGLAGLAAVAARERSTTAHLFRGVL